MYNAEKRLSEQASVKAVRHSSARAKRLQTNHVHSGAVGNIESGWMFSEAAGNLGVVLSARLLGHQTTVLPAVADVTCPASVFLLPEALSNTSAGPSARGW